MNMKKITLSAALIALVALFSININAQVIPADEAVLNLKAYPEKIGDLQRYVIYVAPEENESLFEVELIAGKTMDVDCNNHRLMGQFQEEIVDGWGYSYFVFETDGNVASTMMMCFGEKTEKFIEGQSLTTRYNSRLPLVVYLPDGYELKYRIWTAGEAQNAEKQ